MKAAMVVLGCLLVTTPACAGRAIPDPIVGVTFDDVSKVSKEVQTLSSIAKTPTVRIVFDKGEPPSYYKGPISQFHPVAYIMGELIDSSYMKSYSVSAVQSFTTNYVNTLGSLVDIWEIGNEINGDWLGGSVFSKMSSMFNIVYDSGGKTALTFFYEGEVGQKNCIDSQGGMFPWIANHFQAAPTTESEKIRLRLDYVLISWYPSQCKGVNPDWAFVFSKLASIFPNSKVGFGELGTPNPQGGSAYEKGLIETYYSLADNLDNLPSSYIGGYFWWYAAEEMVPWPGSLGATLNSAIQ